LYKGWYDQDYRRSVLKPREFSAIFDAAENHADYFFPRKDKEHEYQVFEKDLYKTQIYKNK